MKSWQTHDQKQAKVFNLCLTYETDDIVQHVNIGIVVDYKYKVGSVQLSSAHNCNGISGEETLLLHKLHKLQQWSKRHNNTKWFLSITVHKSGYEIGMFVLNEFTKV